MTGYIVLAWVMRSDRIPLHILGLRSNKLLPLWTMVTVISVVIIITIPALRDMLKLTTLAPLHWTLAIIVPLLALSGLEILPLWRFRRTGVTTQGEC